MAIRTRSVDPWEESTYILGYESEPLGPVDISGLEAAVAEGASRENRLKRFPDLEIKPFPQTDAHRWLSEWQKDTFGSCKRDLLIRDNRKDRWIKIKGAFFRRANQDGTGTLVINGLEFVDGPR